jgi:hypothetical protein
MILDFLYRAFGYKPQRTLGKGFIARFSGSDVAADPIEGITLRLRCDNSATLQLACINSITLRLRCTQSETFRLQVVN